MNFRSAAILLLLTCTCARANPANDLCDITFINRSGKKVILSVEVADTDPERKRGLMFRKDLRWNRGMLFVFPVERNLNFWMKNTFLPLSIAYIDNRGVINEIYDMVPLDTSVTYPSRLPARYAVEANRGWFRKNGIFRGSRVILNGCIRK